MGNELVKVELKANPAVTRMMTKASFSQNQSRWRIQGEVVLETINEPKKNDVRVAEESNVDNEPMALINGLRAQYVAKFGDEPDKRWNMKTLSEKINQN